MAKSKRTGDERPRTPAKTADELVWKPSSGHGSAAALDKLHWAERIKRAWREVRTVSNRGKNGSGG